MQLLLWLAVVVVARCGAAAVVRAEPEDPYALPEDLLIGAGVSAIQTEGAWDADGKGESAADHVLHTGKLAALGFSTDGHQHDVAADSYRRFREDVKAAADLGLQLYRFSISWSRLMPDAVTPNAAGVKYYHDLIDEIIKYNMKPMATLYHFDHPWILEEKFKGWQSEQMVDYFKGYARFAFNEYAAKVDLWTTINEPNSYCTYFPSLYLTAELYTKADIDHYQCIRNTMLAHAEAYHTFKDDGHTGKVGVSVLLMSARPNSTSPEDAYAADAFNQMSAGIVLHPPVHGDWPDLVKEAAKDKVRPFTDAQKARLKGTADFIGFNVYYGMVAWFSTVPSTTFANTPIIGPFLQDVPFASVMVYGVTSQNMQDMFSVIEPDAMRTGLVWIWTQYKLPMLVTESGYGEMGTALGKNDYTRGVYHSEFLRSLVTTLKEYDEMKVLGYCTWSLIDSFEWSAGFNRPFGTVHVDYEGGSLERSMKKSSQFWTDLAKTRSVPVWEMPPDSQTTPAPQTTLAPQTTAGTSPKPAPTQPTTPKPSSATAATSALLLLLLALAAPALSG